MKPPHKKTLLLVCAIALFLIGLFSCLWGFISLFASGISTTGATNPRIAQAGYTFLYGGILTSLAGFCIFIYALLKSKQ